DRALAAFRAQLVFKKMAHLTVALADQGDHRDVGRILARHGAEQRAFSDTAAAKQSNALAHAAGQQAVDGANAGHERFRDVLALERAGRRAEKIIFGQRLDGRSAVDGPAETVQHAPQQIRTHVYARIFGARIDGVARLQTVDLFERYRENAAVAKAGHLRPH